MNSVLRRFEPYRDVLLVVGLFVAFRLMWLMAYPADSLTQYGDFPYYHLLTQLAKQGRLPFLGYWIEYPPVFAYLIQGIYALSGDRYQAFATLLGLVMLAFEAGNLVMVFRLAQHLHSRPDAQKLAWVYALLFAPAFVMWHNQDVISTFLLLLAVDEFLRGHSNRSALWIGIGAMFKFFPALLVPVVWRFCRNVRQAVTYTAIVAVVCAVILGPFLVASPVYTIASLRAQTAKSSWLTVWALIDGNLDTGLFGPIAWHTDPSKAVVPQGNPSRIPEPVGLIAFGALYAWIWWKSKSSSLQVSADLDWQRRFMILAAATLLVFLLWSKGWSPQWFVMLIPFVLLVMPLGRALLYILTLSFLNLAEWPVLLSRGMTQWLYLTIPLRTVLLILLTVEILQMLGIRAVGPAESPVPVTGNK